MAAGGVYEDESAAGQQPRSSSSGGKKSTSSSFTPKAYNWSDAELNQLVEEGVLRKDSTSLEHVALHPFWLSNPLNGVKEELDSFLGKWRPSMNGYLVAIKNVRLVKNQSSGQTGRQMGFMYQDQPWIHVDAGATFYLYTPSVGQKLTGTIMKFGTKAVICVLLKCFSASVIPQNSDQFKKWNLGDELPFEITFVQNRRKGPLIRATSTGTSSGSSGVEEAFEDWTLNEDSSASNVHKRFLQPELASDIFESPEEPVRKKKKKRSDHNSAEIDPDGVTESDTSYREHKKHKKKKRNSEFKDFEPSSVEVNVQEYQETPTPISTPKKKKSARIEFAEDTFTAIDEVDEYEQPHKKRKKKKKHKSDDELNDEKPWPEEIKPFDIDKAVRKKTKSK